MSMLLQALVLWGIVDATYSTGQLLCKSLPQCEREAEEAGQ